MTATATKSRKSRGKPARSVRLHDGGPMPEELTVEMTVGGTTSYYFVKPIHADFGRGFEVHKLLCDGGEVYHVLIEAGRHSCDCPGGTYRGHCKHQEAILALIAAGKLAVAPAVKVEAPAVAPVAAQPKPQAVPSKPRSCRFCGCMASEHVDGFCPI